MPKTMNAIYPWTCNPLVVGAPMRLIALAPLAVAVTQAGGFGFLAAGTDVKNLKAELQTARDLLGKTSIKWSEPGILPIGVGFINWGVDLSMAVEAMRLHLPAAGIEQGRTKVWIQIGTVSDALSVAETCHPDVLVVQGADAGGHGLAQGAGIVSLLPEVADALNQAGLGNITLIAAGGIVDGRGTAASLVLGASAVVMGTRLLASKEANIAKGYQDDLLRLKDGGSTTVRTRLYDMLRGTTGWPGRYNGRVIINQSFLDAQKGRSTDENKRLYNDALQKGDAGWGVKGRLTAYAGSGVGLVKEVKSAKDIIEEVRQDAMDILSKFSKAASNL